MAARIQRCLRRIGLPNLNMLTSLTCRECRDTQVVLNASLSEGMVQFLRKQKVYSAPDGMDSKTQGICLSRKLDQANAAAPGALGWGFGNLAQYEVRVSRSSGRRQLASTASALETESLS